MAFDTDLPALETVYAEHGLGGRGMAEPTTFTFDEKGNRTGWIKGHVAFGALLPPSMGARKRLIVRKGGL